MSLETPSFLWCFPGCCFFRACQASMLLSISSMIASARSRSRQAPRMMSLFGKGTQLSCRRFKDNAARLQLFALAYNLANFLRQLVLPRPIRGWTLTTLREKLINIRAKVGEALQVCP